MICLKRLKHNTSTPYSASFSASLDNLADQSVVQLGLAVDFKSYFSSYLNYPFNLDQTPFITASIRNRDTKVVTGSLEFTKKQGQYPVRETTQLSYRNDTGAELENLEFYYQVNIPESTTTHVPEVNLENLSITYNVEGTGYYKSEIVTRKELINSYYYKLKNTIILPSSSIDLETATSQYYTVGLLPGTNTLFKFNDYASISNNVDSLRKSTNILKVDEKSYTPTQGAYQGFFVPENYSIISSSIATGVEGLDQRHFAEVQDSNYYSTGWRNGRYDGSISDNRITGKPAIGNEPVQVFSSFEGKIFDSSSRNDTINEIFSGSIFDADLQNVFFSTLSTSNILGSTETEPVPLAFTASTLFISGSGKITFLNLKEEREFKRIVNSKVYRSDTDQIITTDNKGIVVNIE